MPEKQYTLRDYENDIPPRLFGSETEYTTNNDIQAFLHEGAAENIIDFVNPDHLLAYSDIDSQELFTTTGGRLYMDIGNIEYATPECSSPNELILHERAGEVIAGDVVQNVAASRGTKSVLSKRSGFAHVKFNGEVLMTEDSIGHHENYSSINPFSVYRFTTMVLDRYGDTHPNIDTEKRGLADYLALRKLIDGVGMVDRFGYSITQKPRATNFLDYKNLVEHSAKPAFRQKEGDRLEIRSGEGNKSDFAIALKYGLTSAVLRLIEHGKWPEYLLLENPNRTIRNIAYDPYCNVIMRNGSTMKAIDVLKGIVDEAADLITDHPEAPKYEIKALNDFYKFYDDFIKTSLVENNVSALADRIDWAARYQYLLSKGASHKFLSTRDVDMVKHDLLWDLGPTTDKARHHYKKFGQALLSRELPLPPRDTRAHIRSELAREAFSAGNLDFINWSMIRTKDGHLHELYNPYSSTDYHTSYLYR